MYFDISEIDRTFFELLRLELVAQGFLPDRTLVTTPAGIKTAKANIVTGGKEVIELFGVGNYKDRQKVSTNKIVIDRLQTDLGGIGSYGVYTYRAKDDAPTPAGYIKEQLPANTSNVLYQITYVVESTKYDRIIANIIQNVLDNRGCVQGFREDRTRTEHYFDYVQTDYKDMSGSDYIERVYRFTVSNIYLRPNKVVDTNIATLTEMNMCLLADELGYYFTINKPKNTITPMGFKLTNEASKSFTHNLGRKPIGVTIYDSNNDIVDAEVNSNNTMITVSFGELFTGTVLFY